MSLCLNCFVSILIAHKLVREQIFLLELSLFIKKNLKLRLRLGLFINKHERVFYRADFELFMIGLIHLQPYG